MLLDGFISGRLIRPYFSETVYFYLGMVVLIPVIPTLQRLRQKD
jgi:hypothetical protein